MAYSRILMLASAVVMALAGLGASFLADDLVRWSGAPVAPLAVLLVQLLGAIYLGMAMLNWSVRDAVIGGIYGRPVAMANILHFVPAAIACLKLVLRTPQPGAVWAVAAVYAVFATSFLVLTFRHPLRSPAPAVA
jgi:hypothetical protein